MPSIGAAKQALLLTAAAQIMHTAAFSSTIVARPKPSLPTLSLRPRPSHKVVLYAAAFTIYWYLTFLGYSELPFLRGAVYFLYPVVPVVGAYVLALLLRLNATEIVVAVYFG